MSMSMFSRRASLTHPQYCQSWRDLTVEEVAAFTAAKPRATCHLNKGHLGDHEDKILGVAWNVAGRRVPVYWATERGKDTENNVQNNIEEKDEAVS